MKKFFLLQLIFLLKSSWALELPQTKAEFCARFNLESRGPHINDNLQELTSEPANLIAFKNDGGLFNGGVCWWHSRFQRNLLYLSLFRPELEKPKSTYALQELIHQIRLGKNILIIPGYKNVEEFTKENQKDIQSELNDWQLYDGVVLGGWIDGLKGETEVSSDVLASTLKELYSYVSEKKKIAYVKLQIKGLTSHAWLIVGIKNQTNAYDIGFIDSNRPNQTSFYTYKLGDTSFFTKGYGHFVPYLEFKKEEERLSLIGETFCGNKIFLNNQKLSDDQIMKDEKSDVTEAKRAGVF